MAFLHGVRIRAVLLCGLVHTHKGSVSVEGSVSVKGWASAQGVHPCKGATSVENVNFLFLFKPFCASD